MNKCGGEERVAAAPGLPSFSKETMCRTEVPLLEFLSGGASRVDVVLPNFELMALRSTAAGRLGRSRRRRECLGAGRVNCEVFGFRNGFGDPCLVVLAYAGVGCAWCVVDANLREHYLPL